MMHGRKNIKVLFNAAVSFSGLTTSNDWMRVNKRQAVEGSGSDVI